MSHRQYARESFKQCLGCRHYAKGCQRLNVSSLSPIKPSDRKPCNIYAHLLFGGDCLDDPPKFRLANYDKANP